jgi:adenosine deaminase CECR1
MPKGALLHAHLDACVDKAELLRYAYEHPEVHISISKGLTADNKATTLPEFRPFRPSPFNSGNAGMSAAQGYKGGTWIPISLAGEAFDPALGGPEGFDKWIIDGQIINPVEAYSTHNSLDRVSLCSRLATLNLNCYRSGTNLSQRSSQQRHAIIQFLEAS